MLNQRLSAGNTMIEVIVALAVVTMAAVSNGYLNLGTFNLVKSNESNTRASYLAYEMSERMRLNKAGVIAGAYVHDDIVITNFDCNLTACSNEQLAKYDIYQVQRQLLDTMMSSSTEIKPSARGYEINIYWDDDKSGSTNKNCPKQNANDLDCVSMTVRF